VKTLKEIRRDHILMVLEGSGWNIKKASAILQISEGRLQREAKRLKKARGNPSGNR
jgi:transcriptional regulator with GAF, ATPase, and Fis domain